MNLPEQDNDLQRLKNEYADRENRFMGSTIYALHNPSNLFIHLQRQRETLKLLSRGGFFPLEDRQILEVGCGSGGVLREYIYYGASTRRIYGVELIEARAEQSITGLGRGIVIGDGQNLPVESGSQDLVLQYTVFTSILDANIKKKIATEMLRVVKPDGAIIWYDFWLNPINPQTMGIRKSEIKELFPNCSFTFRKITLAPPLVRKIVPVSWIMASMLEKLNLFNTHYLVLIRPEIS